MRGLISFVFISLLLISCNDSQKKGNLSEEDLQYQLFQLENKGWKSKKHSQKVDAIAFTATEVPIQYYLLKELGNGNLSEVDSLYNENSKERIIEFTFQHENEVDLLEEKYTELNYQKSVEYMSFSIERDFYVVTNKNDTLKCSGVLHERNFKTAPYTKVLLFFSGIDPEDKLQLIYHDRLFQKGILKFNFTDPPLIL
jgi:hypothetical protein